MRNPQQRHAYLHALGVPIWVHREFSGSARYDTTTYDTTINKTAEATKTVDEDSPSNTENTAQSNIQSNAQSVIEELSATLSVSPAKTTKIQNNETISTKSIPVTPVEQKPINCSTMDWQTLQSQIANCQACDLHTSRNQAVTGSGEQSAQCMIIGDAPTYEDDSKGFPFVGQTGQLLNNMLLAIDLPRNTVYLTNTTKCRATNDRMPSSEELTQCYPYLLRQIELVNPEKVLILGRTTAQHLLQQKVPLAKLRGQIHTLPNTQIPTVVTYHPRTLLKQPNDKRKAWEDLKLFRQITSGK